MVRSALRWTKRLATALLLILATVFLVRVVDSQRGAPLGLWLTEVPQEPAAAELDALDWPAYLAREDALFRFVDEHVTQRLPEQDRVALNRYFAESPVNPARLARNWNRSFVLEPEGTPRGAVVLLHGLTDSPYSLRHVAEIYRKAGFVALGIRLPGHGGVPAGLTNVAWPDWLAAARLAAREARRRAGPGQPLHLVGYSNGGALAMKYALDALVDSALPRPDQIVLVSPMIGVTSFARFASIAGWPAIFPAFAEAAWLSVVPEYNPFKYNSFPVNAAAQSYSLTEALQAAIREQARNGVIEGLAPVLTFQSVMDVTVSTPAVLSSLYAHLPDNGSEIVLFDLNRAATFGPLLSRSAQTLLGRILPEGPQSYRTVLVTNASPEDLAVVERIRPAGSTAWEVRPTALAFPREVSSLSHVALPFPVEDGLYGIAPDPGDNQGIKLGTLAVRGEIGVLVVDGDTLLRMSSNPFFPLLTDRLAKLIGP